MELHPDLCRQGMKNGKANISSTVITHMTFTEETLF